MQNLILREGKMPYTSLYRRFRPTTFDGMIGQDHITKTLKNSILNGKISHAYLFTGSRGIGKTSAAKIFARAINCTSPLKDGSPCGKCEVCRELSESNNMDILEIDAASNNGVDEIRDLREKIKYLPSVGKYKVYIIDEVHMLTLSAFNALLKTLEEPPAHAVFILATTEVHKIPQTILSRCMRFDFRLLSTPELLKHLKNILDEMKISYETEALQLIAEAGDGSVRDMLSLADMCVAYSENNIKYDDVLEILGACSPKLILKIVSHVMLGNIQDALVEADKISTLGKNVEQLAKDISKALRNLLYCKNCASANTMLNLPNEIFSEYQILSNSCTNNKILRAIDIFVKIENSLRYTVNPKIILEMSIVKACDVSVSIDTDGILQRLKEIEAKIRTNIAKGEMENTLQPKEAWGYLLNTMQLDKSLAAGYIYATKVDENLLKIDKNVLVITVKTQGDASGLLHFEKDIENILISRFYEVTKIKIVVEENDSIVNQGIEQIKNLFGDDKVKVSK